MSDKYAVTAFYKFTALPDLVSVRTAIEGSAKNLDIQGLVVLAQEGVNGTVAATPNNLLQFKTSLETLFGPLVFKDSLTKKSPFRRFKVRLDQEIVALGDATVMPEKSNSTRLTPQEWEEFLNSKHDYFLVDVRNSYETALGKFKGAVDPKTDKFNQFPEYVRGLDIPKDKPVLMYCTGGIRCEKAAVIMEQAGFKNVYQLEGGILRYIEELPNKSFEGECFVFDRRVAVDQDLAPSKRYALCHYCGDPGSLAIECAKCGKGSVICEQCSVQHSPATCSKNCDYHLKRKYDSTSAEHRQEDSI